MSPRAVVTGIGVVAPNGIGTESYWAATRDGQSGIERISRFDASGYDTQLAGEVAVARVNGPKHKALLKRLRVTAYPTILYLRDGTMREYDGGKRTTAALAATRHPAPTLTPHFTETWAASHEPRPMRTGAAVLPPNRTEPSLKTCCSVEMTT